jgi:tRNA (cytidine/uridine-2'-O-)-methyltransferase
MHDTEHAPALTKIIAQPGFHPELVEKPAFDFHIVLVEPEIPPNTGNAGRLCVATQSTLHIVGTPGFNLTDKEVRRAGLDYWKYVKLVRHDDFDAWLRWWETHAPQSPFFIMENAPGSQNFYGTSVPTQAAFVFGKETVGLRKDLVARHLDKVREVPMFSSRIRSLNLANTVSLVLFEAIRQNLPTQ